MPVLSLVLHFHQPSPPVQVYHATLGNQGVLLPQNNQGISTSASWKLPNDPTEKTSKPITFKTDGQRYCYCHSQLGAREWGLNSTDWMFGLENESNNCGFSFLTCAKRPVGHIVSQGNSYFLVFYESMRLVELNTCCNSKNHSNGSVWKRIKCFYFLAT